MYLFLDIDGVLGPHDWSQEAESNIIDKECVWCFNQIIRAAQPKVVISSAWRYMINNGAMTTKGFEYMLRTHGVSAKLNIVGATRSDEEYATRPQQIQAYRNENDISKPYIILDDMDFNWYPTQRCYFYKTSSYFGLQRKDIQPILNLMEHYNK